MKRLLLAISLLFVTGALSAAEPDVAQPKFKIGDEVANIVLKNHRGVEVSLTELRKKSKFVALVFVRSADW